MHKGLNLKSLKVRIIKLKQILRSSYYRSVFFIGTSSLMVALKSESGASTAF